MFWSYRVADWDAWSTSFQLVNEDDEVMLVTDRGQTLRTKVSEIRETGRGAQGVRVTKLDEGDKVVAAARVGAEE